MVVSFLQSQIFFAKVQENWDKSDSFLKEKKRIKLQINHF